MSVLRTIIGRACSQYSSLMAPRVTGVLGISKAEFSDNVKFNRLAKKEKREHYKKSMQVDETGQESSVPITLRHELEYVRKNDMRPGYGNFPSADIYDQKYDGVRYDELTMVHITCTRNNTKGYATQGKNGEYMIVQKSGGTVGFKHARKSSNVAAQTVGQQIGQVLMKRKLNNIRVEFDGTGIHRLTALRGLLMLGITVVSIADRTYPCFNDRPRKPRRV